MSAAGADREDDEAESREPTVSWFELFYDLVVVAALSLCNDAYLLRPGWATGLSALLSIAALAWVWFLTTLLNNIFPAQDLVRRLLLLVQMGCIVVAALSVDQVKGLSNTVGLTAYGASLLIVAILAVWAGRGSEYSRLVRAGIVPVVLAAVICFTGALAPDRFSGYFLLAALTVSVVSLMAVRFESAQLTAYLRVDHLHERRGLFILIILGEGFAQLVQALHIVGQVPRGAVFTMTFLLSFAIWWIYFDGTFARRHAQMVEYWRLALLGHLTLIYGMAGTLDLLVLVTVQEESQLGDYALIYFACSLAVVFFSFALIGFTAHGRVGLSGWVQVGSGVVLITGSILLSGDNDTPINAVMFGATALVVGNALLAVWVEGIQSSGWRRALGRKTSDTRPDPG